MSHTVAWAGSICVSHRSRSKCWKVDQVGRQLAPYSCPTDVTQAHRAVDASTAARAVEGTRLLAARQRKVAGAAKPTGVAVAGVVGRAHTPRAAVPGTQPVLQNHKRAIVACPWHIARAGAVGAETVSGTVV